jgi:hypothetical protein
VDYENQTISLHLTGAGDAEVKVSDLTDDQLEELWVDARVDVARLALRERIGIDISKGVDDLTGDDARWYIEWKQRQKEKKAIELEND